ncbi:MAG TPA: AAA family ATPase [Burkholderiaceae bacterium]|nr:AAA family ATPase [Burkholderiaceae bacterium]
MQNEAELVRFLMTDPAAAQAAGTVATRDVVIHETHTAIVVLAGTNAYKLKRAITLPYLDFSDSERRWRACLRELELNRRTAPDLYLAARRITRATDGGLELDGDGPAVDSIVHMQRFADSDLLADLALRKQLSAPIMTQLARDLARFHRDALVSADPGGHARIAAILDLNAKSEAGSARILGTDAPLALGRLLRQQLSRHAELLDHRAGAGKVRLCHGDLHLGNICMWKGRAVPFDCLEFNDDMATTDVLYDLAFLLMDLWRYQEYRLANLTMNRYMDETGDVQGLPLLPFFIALRASIRAQVLATQASMADDNDHATRCTRQARQFLDLAFDVLQDRPATLMAIGGLSGTGKSTLAMNLADAIGPVPGARVLSSDRIRKQLAGVPAETVLPAHSYTPEASRKVYQEQVRRAGLVLATGHAVIADAVFSKIDERQAIEACASRHDVPFAGVWLEANADTLIERVDARVNDPSDATADVVQQQLARDPGPVDWIRISADNKPEQVASNVREAIKRRQ